MFYKVNNRNVIQARRCEELRHLEVSHDTEETWIFLRNHVSSQCWDYGLERDKQEVQDKSDIHN